MVRRLPSLAFKVIWPYGLLQLDADAAADRGIGIGTQESDVELSDIVIDGSAND